VRKLAEALERSVPDDKDARLAALEACSEFEPGLLCAIRQVMAPQCADALVLGYLQAPPASLGATLRDAMIGHALLARFDRVQLRMSALEAASPPSPPSKAAVIARVQSQVEAYLRSNAGPLEAVSEPLVDLTGYGRGIALAGRGLAKARLAASLRALPLSRRPIGAVSCTCCTTD
jgi:hypothetical protein